jgi:hypothetical protein
MDFTVNDDYLEEILAKVERVRNWSPRVISKLENSIRTANDEDLFRVSPLQWALQKSVDEYEAVDLFLHGAKAGLFYGENLQGDWLELKRREYSFVLLSTIGATR